MITFSAYPGCVYDGDTLIGHVSCVYGVFRAWRLRDGEQEIEVGFASADAARDWIRSSK